MLAVMLVDDEVNVTEGLKKTIEWEKHGFCVVSIANNGEDGLTKASEAKPDLIITDITMPKMDGFEMVERIRERQPEVNVIFLTCHEDFTFAKKAFTLSVDEYLTKDTMTREELYFSLDKIRRNIEKRQIGRKKVNELSMEINQNRYHLSEILINELIEKKFIDTSTFERRLNIYGYNLRKQKYTLSVITVDRFWDLMNSDMFRNDKKLMRFVIMNIVEEILKRNGIGEVFPKSENEYVIIYNYNPNLKYSVNEKIYSVSKEIQDCIRKVIKSTCTIYIGVQFGALLEIKHAYKDIILLENDRFYSLDESILIQANRENNFTKLDYYYANDFVKEFGRSLEELDIETLTQAESAFFEKAKREKNLAADVKTVVEILISNMISTLEKNSCSYQQVFQGDYLRKLSFIDNIFKLEEIFHNYLAGTIEVMKKNAAYASMPEMRKILKYITNHLQEDISLETLAAYVNMNSSYFSRYFKSKTGTNFVDFLTRIRVEKAKELLMNTELSIDEISVRVGHVNKAYFTKVFKKVTGFNPGEFRKKKYV